VAGAYPVSDKQMERILVWRPRASAAALAATFAALPIAYLIAWGARRRIRRGQERNASILPHFALLAAVLAAVPLTVVSASLPSRNLAFMLVLVTGVAGLTGALFAPARRISWIRIGAIAALVSAVLFALGLISDARIDHEASHLMSQTDSYNQRLLQAMR
jgi:cyanate permease